MIVISHCDVSKCYFTGRQLKFPDTEHYSQGLIDLIGFILEVGTFLKILLIFVLYLFCAHRLAPNTGALCNLF